MLSLQELIELIFIDEEDNQKVDNIIRFLYAKQYNSFQIIDEYDTLANINNNENVLVPSELIYAFIRNVAPKEEILDETVQLFLEDNNIEILDEDENHIDSLNFGAILIGNNYINIAKDYLDFRNKILNEEILNINYSDRINTFLDYLEINEVYLDEELFFNLLDVNDILFETDVSTFNNLNQFSNCILNEDIGGYILGGLLAGGLGLGALAMSAGSSITNGNDDRENAGHPILKKMWNGTKYVSKLPFKMIGSAGGAIARSGVKAYNVIKGNSGSSSTSSPSPTSTPSGNGSPSVSTPTNSSTSSPFSNNTGNNTSPPQNGSSGTLNSSTPQNQQIPSGNNNLPSKTQWKQSAKKKILFWKKNINNWLNVASTKIDNNSFNNWIFNMIHGQRLNINFNDLKEPSKKAEFIGKAKRIVELHKKSNESKLTSIEKNELNNLRKDPQINQFFINIITGNNRKDKITFKQDKNRADELRKKIFSNTSTPEERAEYNRLLIKRNGRLRDYYTRKNEYDRKKEEVQKQQQQFKKQFTRDRLNRQRILNDKIFAKRIIGTPKKSIWFKRQRR